MVRRMRRAVSSTPTTVFFPLFPWLLQSINILIAVSIMVELYSVGDPINRIVNLAADTGCYCAGEAALFKVRYI